MHGYQFSAIGKRGFDLDFMNHFSHPIHDVVAAEQRRAVAHQLSDGAAIPRSLQEWRRKCRPRLRDG
jgi:hypothetical protein